MVHDPDFEFDPTALLNTDALCTFRDALKVYVVHLADVQFKRYLDKEKEWRVVAPGAYQPELRSRIVECCDLASEIDKVIGERSWLADLGDAIEKWRSPDDDTVYRCKCSWVGGDPDIGPRRMRGKRILTDQEPTCPACWSKDRKRALVVEQCPKCRGAAHACKSEPCLHCDSCGHVYFPGQPDASNVSYKRFAFGRVPSKER